MQRSQSAYKAFEGFGEMCGARYPRSWECLRRDKEELLAFHDFPAEHWRHIRTTNPIESTFAPVCLRHRKTKGCGTRKTVLAMMFKLAESASKGWYRLNAHLQIISLLEGKRFINGILQVAA